MNMHLLEVPPSYDTVCVLAVDALSPLSMVAKAPGKYYLSQDGPSDAMIYGLLENALGWHIGTEERTQILRWMQKKYKLSASKSEVGYASLLQFHVAIDLRFIPPVTKFQDLWSQHLKGAPFWSGSREHDERAIPIKNAIAAKEVSINDKADAIKDPLALSQFKKGQTVHLGVIRPYFPQYYVSPTPREYVEPSAPYRIRIRTSQKMAVEIRKALDDPAAPLYLGSNDGWVEAGLEVLP